MLVLFGSLKVSKIHPFCIVLYFFRLKGLDDEKGFLEFPLRPFSDSLKLKRTELSLSLNSLKRLIATNLSIDENEFHYR